MNLVLDFHASEATDAANTGGKGANLSRLTQAGFPVPEGFVLTAHAYELFVASATKQRQEVRHLLRGAPALTEQESEQLQELLRAVSIPEAVLIAVDRALSDFPPGTAFSVRSSATTEDLGCAAFAGQHETYLNCIDRESIADRIRDCWVSLWSSRAITYRRSADFDVDQTSMAVVVQRMVNCDVAGVGFSINPITGNVSEQVFDANYGLGESVVSGETAVDHFTVVKASGEIISQNIGEKQTRVVARAETNGVEETPLPLADCGRPCLTEVQIHTLSTMLTQIEQFYGYPQDIEWGFVGDTLWLLQSRPVTRLVPRWTREESAERFPNVITPLAWDLVEEGFHRSLNHSFALMGLPPFKDKWFAMFDHYIYGNQTAVDVYANCAASSIRIQSLSDLAEAIPLLRKRYEWVQELPLAWSRDLDYYLTTLGELMTEPLDDYTDVEIWDYINRVKELGAKYFLPNIAISITQRTLYQILHNLLVLIVGADKAAATFDQLLAHCETKTGIINKELYRLSQRIREVPELADRLRTLQARRFLDEGGFLPWPEIERTYDKFLRDHGHREVDFDPYHATWIEAPWLVIDNLKIMLDSQMSDPVEKERTLKVSMRQSEDDLTGKLPSEVRFFVQEIIRLARAYTTLDDVEHYQTTRLTLPFRRGLRALGTRLVTKGVLSRPMDVFFAHYAALDEAARRDDPLLWSTLADTIRIEKAEYLKHRRAAPTEFLGQDDSPIATAGNSLSGLPGSPGSARGELFKVYDSNDFAEFPEGAVLVARTTNPAWTPLFYRAAAVITESGGPLSHGAVTAREIGLPAVMSVKGAMSLLENGQTVTVDGNHGRITLSD